MLTLPRIESHDVGPALSFYKQKNNPFILQLQLQLQKSNEYIQQLFICRRVLRR